MLKIKIILLIFGLTSFSLVFGQNFDNELIAILDTIHKEDQRYREASIKIEKEYGYDSKESEDNSKLQHNADSANLIRVRNIIDRRGWLGSNIIGEKGNKTLFLVIQHSDIETQEKYLPILKKAVKKGDAKVSYYAFLKDRVSLRQGGKQIYGSQLFRDFKTMEWELSPMIDPDNVDKRRQEVGLDSLNIYLKFWDITYDVERFKKRMKVYDSVKNKN